MEEGLLHAVQGYMYPNEVELQWSILIVLYPFTTGLVSPLPLQLHLGHPERSIEMYLTPHTSSAMAMFGFIYLWYLMAVLVLEIWLDYRKDIVLKARSETGWKKTLYRALALGVDNISEESLRIDDKLGRFMKGLPIYMPCVDTIARYLMYAFLIDFSIEMLDLIHRIYEADESFKSLDFMVHTRLYTSQILIQIVFGTIVPIGFLAFTQLVKLSETARK